ncbi:MAG: signal peptide peptidase SppA [Candidatus Aminicenantales bacterium]
MKRSTYVLIIILIFFILITATCVSFFYFATARPPAVKTHSYLEINLSGEIQEYPIPDLFLTMFPGMRPLSLHKLWMNIRKAKADRRIETLFLRIGYLECGWAKINELREAILNFRESGKKAYAFLEEGPDLNKEYYLATACDRIILQPTSSLTINGLGGYIPFLKNTLKKLGIEAEFEHVEEFKTAANILTEEKFTPAHREMMESIYGDYFSHYLKVVAEARGKSEKEVKKLIDRAFFYGQEAVKSGLVDDLLYEDQVIELMKGEEEKINRISYEAYSRIKPSSLGLNRGKKIALIYGSGPIHTGEGYYQTMGSRTIARWLKKAREDASIKAVVFRVDSPGGSAVGSDIIWREVVLTKKEKPFVVSMSDVAGSGGYWVSMAADKIVAQPQTLTGSIGVLGGKFNLASLYEKIGVTAEKLTFGKNADIFSTFRSFTPEERRLLKKELLWVYDQFLSKVAQGRNISREDVDAIGRGRVWTGNQAKELGLVDEIGGLSRAIELAKEQAGIPPEEEVKIVVFPPKISLFQALFGKKEARVNLNFKPKLDRLIDYLEILGRERIWAIMPLWTAPQ